MTRATVGFLDANGNFQPVKASRPLPTTGGGGGGTAPPDLTEAQVKDPASTVFGSVSGQRISQAVTGKVDRPANAPGQTGRLITFDATGTVQTILPSVTAASAGAAVVRTTAGHIILPAADPTNDSWAVRKKYVDDINAALDARIDALEAMMATAIQGDGTVKALVAKTQAEYDAISPKVATTQYTIKGA